MTQFFIASYETLSSLQPVRSAYQPPASSIFLSEQISHPQSASSTFLSEQFSTSHQPNEQVAYRRINNTDGMSNSS
jgi:hypothetical protein